MSILTPPDAMVLETAAATEPADVVPLPRFLMATAPPVLRATQAPAMPYSPVGPQQGSFDDSYPLVWPGHDGQFYVPVFALGTDTVGTGTGTGTQQHYRASLEAEGNDWSLTLNLTQAPSTSLRGSPSDVHNAQPLMLDGAYRVSLSYTVETATGDYRKRSDFSDISVTADGIRATLHLDTAEEQGEVYAALTTRDLDAQLLVSRTLTIGLPVELPNPDVAALTEELHRLEAMQICYVSSVIREGQFLSGTGLSPTPVGLFVENFSGHDVVGDGDIIRLRLDGTNVLNGTLGAENDAKAGPAINPAPPYQRLFLRKVTAVGTRIPVGSSGPYRLSFGGIDLSTTSSLSDVAAQMMRAFVFTAVDSSDPLYAQKNNIIAAQKDKINALPRLYDTSRTTVIQFDSPLVLIPNPLDLRKHPYVFHVPAPAQFQATGLIQTSVAGSSYFQDAGRPQRFYYLPDRFVFGTKADGTPNVRIRATTDVNAYVVSYTAVPVVNTGRLKRDEATLLPMANRLLSEQVSAVEFAPLLGDSFSFNLNMPQGTGWANVLRPDVVSDLHRPIVDAFTLTANELRSFYDALTAGQTRLFHGTVTVKLGDWANEGVAFEGDLPGDRDTVWNQIFDQTVPATFGREITVTAVDSAFKGADAISVSFQSGDAVTLRPRANSAKATVSQPISEFVMSKPDVGSYTYTISYVSSSGQFIAPVAGTGIGNTLFLK